MPERVKTREAKQWVDRIVQERKSLYDERNKLIYGLRKQRMMRLKPKPTEAYQQYLGQGVRVPVSFRLIETVIGAIAGGPRPTHHVLSDNPELARRASRWLELLTKQNEMQTQRGYYWRLWDSYIGDGLVFIKTTRHPWTEFPEHQEGDPLEGYRRRVEAFLRTRPPLPLRSRIVDAATVYPPVHEWAEAVVVESGLRPTDPTLRQLGLRVTGRGNIVEADESAPISPLMPGLRMAPQIEVDEVWTEKELYVRAGGNVWVYPNEFGMLPYTWASGSAVAWSDPTLQAMSVVYPLMYLEPWIAQFLSQLVAAAATALTPTPIGEQEARGSVSGQGQPVVSDWQGGKYHQFPPGVKFRWDAPPIDNQAVNVLNAMTQIAERYTLSPVPSFAGTRTPGTVMAQVAERVTSILKPRVDMASALLAEQDTMYLKLLQKVIRVPVRVSGLVFEERSGRSRLAETALRPGEVARLGDVNVEIQFKTMQDQIAWNTMSVMMQQSGVWSMERTRRETGVRDPQAEGDTIGFERVMESQPIQMYLAMKAMEGQPPLEALQELQSAAEGAVQSPLEGMGSGGPEAGNGSRPTGGRLTGEPRLPGGERALTAQRFLGA